MKKKRVLLLSEGFGSGHTQAAHAISAGLRRLSAGVVTRVLELGAFQHPVISSWIFKAYRKTIISNPSLYGRLYRSQGKKSLSRLSSLALHRLFYSKTEEIITQLKPDVVVCTHPFPSIVVSRLKRAGLEMPLCAVVTDYDAHGSWVDSAVNVYMVSTPEVKRKFIDHGIPENRIVVTGIPVHPKFWSTQDKSVIREEFGLRPIPTVMLMGGGWGLIQSDELIQGVANWRDKLQVIVCLGSNEKQRAKLAEDPALRHPNVRLLGYTKDIDKLMDVSDLLITKPGGLTCTEAMTKGVPMLFYNPIPGQEEENSHFFIENGYADRIDTIETLDRWLERLVREYGSFSAERELRLLQAHESPIYRPEHGPETIMAFLEARAESN